ncbi:MAG TPA: sulfatase-like hydrolase/transferase [Gammaproteobacteria bacterium]|nr:sulfatase-like hydrolase/transferase [Gammaproteobacteria bacterium]
MNSERPFIQLLPALTLVFLAVIVMDFVGYAMVPLSAWRLDWFGIDVRLSMIAYEIALTVLWVAVPVAALALIGRKLPSAVSRIAGALLLWLAIAFIGASWMFYVASGDFLGIPALSMWWSNFTEMWQHIVTIAPMVLLYLMGGSLVVAVLILSLSSLIRRKGHSVAIRLAAGFWIAAGLLCAVITVWGQIQVPSDQAKRYEYIKSQRNGPFAYLTHTVIELIANPAVPPVPQWADQYFKRPARTGNDAWLAKVDRSKVKKENVILLVVESLRHDALTTFGGDREAMPTLDALARNGYRFANDYTQASHSNYADLVPLCSNYPLRAAATYTYPKVYTYPHVLLYDLLKPLGWRTAIFSSQNESWGGMANFLKSENLDHFLHAETYKGPTYVPRYDKWFVAWMKGEKRAGKIDDRFTVNEAIKWIGDGSDKPFFIYMNLQSSHLPYDIPKDFDPPFDLPEGVTKVELHPGLMRILGNGKITREQKVGAVKTRYLNSLAYLDSQFGRLVAMLKESGQLQNTLFVVTADTGQAFFEHGSIGHGGIPWNEVVRVPLFFHGPGIEPGQESGLAMHLDIAPTILSLLGLPPHPSFQGNDLFNVPADQRPPAFVVTQSPIAESLAVVWHDWKYVYDLEANDAMLFDLAADPHEQHNLVGQAPAGLVPALGRLLGVWRRAQINYYQDVSRHVRQYSPRLPPGFSLRSFYEASVAAVNGNGQSRARVADKGESPTAQPENARANEGIQNRASPDSRAATPGS